MTPDPSTRADQIVEEAMLRRPRWHNTSRVPAWFSGEELEVLTPLERRELYKKLQSRHQVVCCLPFIVAGAVGRKQIPPLRLRALSE